LRANDDPGLWITWSVAWRCSNTLTTRRWSRRRRSNTIAASSRVWSAWSQSAWSAWSQRVQTFFTTSRGRRKRRPSGAPGVPPRRRPKSLMESFAQRQNDCLPARPSSSPKPLAVARPARPHLALRGSLLDHFGTQPRWLRQNTCEVEDVDGRPGRTSPNQKGVKLPSGLAESFGAPSWAGVAKIPGRQAAADNQKILLPTGYPPDAFVGILTALVR
jgi:hypothetical protein